MKPYAQESYFVQKCERNFTTDRCQWPTSNLSTEETSTASEETKMPGLTRRRVRTGAQSLQDALLKTPSRPPSTTSAELEDTALEGANGSTCKKPNQGRAPSRWVRAAPTSITQGSSNQKPSYQIQVASNWRKKIPPHDSFRKQRRQHLQTHFT